MMIFPAAIVLYAVIHVTLFIVFKVRDKSAESRPETRSGTSAITARSIVFIGSSTIDRFPLATSFPGKPCVNLGQGNENALQLRQRLAGVLPPVAPAGIVLYAGSADFRFEPGLPAEAVGDRVRAVVTDLRARFPVTPIVLLQVLPARAQSEIERAALKAVNGVLAALARDQGLTFVRTNRPPLVDAQGDLVEALSTDRFHLNEAGYRPLAKWIAEDGGVVGALLR